MVRRFAELCWVLGALGLVVAACAVFWAALSTPTRRIALLPAPGETAPARKLPATSADALAQLSRRADDATLGLAGASARPEALRALLYVDTDTRGEVLVDGRSVGQAPYVGDVVCSQGDVVTVEWLAEGGQALEFRRPCAREMRITPERDRPYVPPAP